MIPMVDLFSFVFWEKLKTTKRHFEINWPLRMYVFVLQWVWLTWKLYKRSHINAHHPLMNVPAPHCWSDLMVIIICFRTVGGLLSGPREQKKANYSPAKCRSNHSRNQELESARSFLYVWPGFFFSVQCKVIYPKYFKKLIIDCGTHNRLCVK